MSDRTVTHRTRQSAACHGYYALHKILRDHPESRAKLARAMMMLLAAPDLILCLESLLLAQEPSDNLKVRRMIDRAWHALNLAKREPGDEIYLSEP
jgi:hypothetical protein